MSVATPFASQPYVRPEHITKVVVSRDAEKTATAFSFALAAKKVKHKLVRHRCGTVFFITHGNEAIQFSPS